MPFKMTTDDALAEFQRRATPLVTVSNRADLKKLFSSLSAAACMQDGWGASETMAEALKDALLKTSQRVRRNVFEDL